MGRNVWMVRAGSSGSVAEDFHTHGCVAVSWADAKGLENTDSEDELRRLIREGYPDKTDRSVATTIGTPRPSRAAQSETS